MKKQTKFMLSLATVSMIVGAIGIGINIAKIQENRLDEELAIPTNNKQLTIEVAKGSQLDLQVHHSSNPTLHLSEAGFVPSNIDFKLTEKDDGWHLLLKKAPVQEPKVKIGFYASPFNSVSIQLPKQISELTLVAPDNQQGRINLGNLNLENLTATNLESNLDLYNVKIDQLETSLTAGSFSANDLTVYKESDIKSKTNNIDLSHSQLMGKSTLTSTSGNIKVFASELENSQISDQKGLISYENNDGKADIRNQYGDIYLINPQNTSEQAVMNQAGSIFATVLEKQQDAIRFAIENPKTNVQAFDKAQIVTTTENKNEQQDDDLDNQAANVSLHTDSGAIQIMRFMVDHESSDSEMDDSFDENQELYYYLDKQGIKDNRADYLSFNTVYYSSERFVNLP
ncbi:DUF4097 family beta strand repeat-containing protein [Vagococcus zengguangii]|uniref:DUF4097 domain-containing protein n=1 Tax=Vagococcus zengguangii TaxID=2571750 RepID=A0A4D7CWM0_9ENTE|nr:DUF4097 family beta strand repeat-containing protein [Vagococcus zengguangii]QCI86737.1 DUF4097 domain-containing protein [Vagococcus zengguangii]TLG79503.1 DUF4097 domain-containing protein [Vagococcus zengguangii]